MSAPTSEPKIIADEFWIRDHGRRVAISGNQFFDTAGEQQRLASEETAARQEVLRADCDQSFRIMHRKIMALERRVTELEGILNRIKAEAGL